MGSPSTASSTETKDEAATASVINTPQTQSGTETKDEAAHGVGDQHPADPVRHGDQGRGRDGVGHRALEGSVSQEEANRTDPHGPASALP